MKRLGYLMGVTGMVLLGWPAGTLLAAPPPVLITKLQTGTTTSALSEAVEITNVSEAAVTTDGWRLQYKSAGGTTWATRAALSGQLQPRQILLIASKEYAATAEHTLLQSGLAAAGGHIRLLESDGTEVDLLGWGTARSPLGSSAAAPVGGQYLLRKQQSGQWQHTAYNAADFSLQSDLAVAVEEPSPAEPVPQPVAKVSSTTPHQPAIQTPVDVTITELMPNPAAPLTDSENEYIELYNAAATPADIGGFALQTGNGYKNSYRLPAGSVIPAGAYAVFYSHVTKLALSNAGSQVRLVDTNKAVVSETPAYDKADAGASWSQLPGGWQWSLRATPGAANVAEQAAAVVADADVPAGTAKSAKKPAAAKPTAPAAKSDSAAAQPEGQRTQPPATVHPAVLGGAGALAALYAAYEYRHDVANKLFVLRRLWRLRKQTADATADSLTASGLAGSEVTR